MANKYAATAISVSLLLASANLRADINNDIVLGIEEPSEASVMTGISNLRGWAVSPVKIDHIEWFLDGEAKGVIPYGGDREDVGQQYPQITGSGLSGFSSTLNYSLLPAGAHTLSIRVVDENGDHQESTVSFDVTAFKSAFIAGAHGASIANADIRKQGENILLNNVDAEGNSYNIVLTWNQATQSFYPTDIDLIADNNANQGSVIKPNQAPKAVDDSVTVIQDSRNNSIDVLVNDTDPEGHTLTITGITNPAHGTAVIDKDKISYTPASGFSGSDSFSYTINDGNNGENTAAITITVETTKPVASAIPDVKGIWKIQANSNSDSCSFLNEINAEYNLTNQEDTEVITFSGTISSLGKTTDISGQMNADGDFTSSNNLSIALVPGCTITTDTEGNFLNNDIRISITGLSEACPSLLDVCINASYSGTIRRP